MADRKVDLNEVQQIQDAGPPWSEIFDQAMTAIGPAADVTAVVAPVVDYPDTGAQAWSEWQNPTLSPMRPMARMSYRRWGFGWLKYLVPAAIVAVVMMAVLGGHQEVKPPVPAPAPAPTQTWAPALPWQPSPERDAAYLKAMNDAGWDTSNRVATLDRGHWSCTYLSQGHTKSELVHYWDQTPYQGETQAQNHADDEEWMGIVINSMCPQYG